MTDITPYVELSGPEQDIALRQRLRAAEQQHFDLSVALDVERAVMAALQLSSAEEGPAVAGMVRQVEAAAARVLALRAHLR